MSTHGILIVNKPRGKTSRWTTNKVSRLLRQKKAGHLGTLDPNATGVLPVVLGLATKLIRYLEADHKVYQGVVRLGEATNTQDAAGEIVATGDCSAVTPEQIKTETAAFQGEISQLPPMYSALKKDGKPLYKLARQGIEVERETRKVTVFEIEVVSIQLPDLTIRVRCSPGTYMRTLAHDLGQNLGCGAHLKDLARLAAGPFTIDQAVDLEGLDPETAREKLIPLRRCLPDFPEVELTDNQVYMIRDGASITAPTDLELNPGAKATLSHQGQLIAVAQGIVHGQGMLLRPLRVMPKIDAG